MAMKIFLSIFAVSFTIFFFFFSLSVAYSWIFYLSATIHKDYMFLFCNSLLVFICLNSRSSISPEKDHGRELVEKKQARTFGDEKEMGSLHVRQVREDWDPIAGDGDEKVGETLSDVVEETYNDDYHEEVAGDYKTLLDSVEETRDDELEAVEDDKTLSVIEDTRDNELEVVETQDDEIELVEDDKTLSVEETKDDELEMVEGDKIPLVVEETQDDELEARGDDRIFPVVEETQDDDEQEQVGSVDTISLEELHRKCEEFIRRMKVQIQTIQCH